MGIQELIEQARQANKENAYVEGYKAEIRRVSRNTLLLLDSMCRHRTHNLASLKVLLDACERNRQELENVVGGRASRAYINTRKIIDGGYNVELCSYAIIYLLQDFQSLQVPALRKALRNIDSKIFQIYG